MSDRTIKASMIDDADILLRIAAHAGTRWTQTWDLHEWYPTIPLKVLIAKAGQLIKRKLIDGCACGCRGDFEITAAGAAWLARVEAVSRDREVTH